MNSEDQSRNVILLCATGCGFYGSPTTRNLCSKCYRHAIQKEQQELHLQKNNNDNGAIVQQLSVVSAETSSRDELRSGGFVNDSCASSQDAFAPPIPGGAGKNSVVASSEMIESPNGVANSVSAGVSGDVDMASNCSSAATGATDDNSDHQSVQSSDSTVKTSPRPDSGSLAVEKYNTVNPESATNDAATAVSAAPPLTGGGDVSSEAHEERPAQTNKSRCWSCNKRVGLLGFQCRCGFTYCGQHRHADTHSCDFDFKAYDRHQLSKANQKVVAEKVAKI